VNLGTFSADERSGKRLRERKPTSVLLFFCREALVEMDVPTRQSYVAAWSSRAKGSSRVESQTWLKIYSRPSVQAKQDYN